jgi:hypothetical protein
MLLAFSGEVSGGDIEAFFVAAVAAMVICFSHRFIKIRRLVGESNRRMQDPGYLRKLRRVGLLR